MNFKKLVRFIKSDKEKLNALYHTIEGYQFFHENKLNFIIGVPLTDKISPIGITAHLDCHDELEWRTSEELQGRIYWDKNREVLFGKVNGDDRTGCYAIYEIAKACEYKPYLLLFDGEESGSIGCNLFIDNYEKIVEELKCSIMNKCNFLIALDRQGTNDAIYYTSDNPDFKKYIEDFGFKEKEGLYSDIQLLEKEYKKCGVNLSIGYLNNHSNREFIFLKDLRNTIEQVIKICNKTGETNPTFKYQEKRILHYGLDYNIYSKYDYNYKHQERYKYGENVFKGVCEGCGKEKHVKVLTDREDLSTYNLCKKCRKAMKRRKLQLPGLSTDIEKEKIGTNLFCDECGKALLQEEAFSFYGDYYLCEQCVQIYNYSSHNKMEN